MRRFPTPPLQGVMGHPFTISHGLSIRRDGLWLIPDFQRPLVWTQAQKVRFMESIVLQLPIGSYCYHDSGESQDDIVYTLLDGQQRWSAIYDYFDGKFPLFGLYVTDLTKGEFRWLEHRPFDALVARGLSYDQQRDVYMRLAYGGTPHVALEEVHVDA